jgi:mRNA interferase MazF
VLNEIKRSQVYLVDFGVREGNVEMGVRPAIVVNNDVGSRYGSILSVVPLTTSIIKLHKKLPTHTILTPENSGVKKISIAMSEQLTVISKSQIVKEQPLFELNDEIMDQINYNLMVQFNLLQCRLPQRMAV